LNRLHGILTGISSDYKITDKEIAELNNWLNLHEYLHHVHPFAGTVTLLKRCLEDGIIDEDEREDILEWCLRFHDGVPECVTAGIRRLHGVLHGIAIDERVTEDELHSLKDWLIDFEVFKDSWPFNDVWRIVETIMDDGVVTKEEEAEFLEFCQGFKECVIDDPKVHDPLYDEAFMQAESPYLKPFTALCDRECQIQFAEKGFCFTGPARTGPRRDLAEIVKSLEGIPYRNVVYNVDYLVIGAQSSPAWAYSTYGRKIEKVIERREKGQEITILHEDDFISQASSRLPELSVK
jgi:hypothetical protein